MPKSPVLRAMLLSGMLDALFATTTALVKGGDIAALWRGVAAGPFGDVAEVWGIAGSLLGLAVHFTLMALMAGVLFAALRLPTVARMNWVVLGLLYGLATYLVMYGIVLPWRFGSHFPQTDPVKIASALFAHVGLVGLVMAWLFRRISSIS